MVLCRPSVSGQSKSRSKFKTNSGENIHRLKTNICDDWYSGNYCECKKGATVIDLRSIKGYQVEEKILGDVDTCGWVVLRGVKVTDSVVKNNR